MPLLRLLGRYGLAGLANTGLGFGLILICDVALHLRPVMANAVGYIAGWVLSYGLNRWFVFRSRGSHRVTGMRYFAALAISFAANQAVLLAALEWLPATRFSHAAAQAAGVVTYTGLMFVLCATWVFRESQVSTQS